MKPLENVVAFYHLPHLLWDKIYKNTYTAVYLNIIPLAARRNMER